MYFMVYVTGPNKIPFHKVLLFPNLADMYPRGYVLWPLDIFWTFVINKKCMAVELYTMYYY